MVFTARAREATPYDSSGGDGYERHFGLVEPPFALTPNPRFLFKSRSITDALDHVSRALKRREALIVVTGDAGTGKTLLCRLVLQRLEPRTFVCVITNPLLSRDDLLRQALSDFGVVSGRHGELARATGHELVTTLHQFLTSLSALRAHAVIVIDEAQHLQPDVLEQVRLLSNFETEDNKLLQIILVGQTELDRLLSTPALRQLEQRISRRHLLQPLGASEVQQYIERRLWIAHGGPDAVFDGRDHSFWRVQFTPGAIRAVAMLSAGLPRVINVLCDRALEIGYQRRKESIDSAEVLSAAQLLKFPTPLALRLGSRRVFAAAAAVLMTTGAVFAASVLHSRSGSASRADAADAASAPISSAAASPTSQPTIAPLVAVESFSVVAATFRTPDRAAALASRAAALGLPAFTRVTAGSWHEVVIGPYISRDEAQKAQQRLDAAQIKDTQIVATLPNAG